MLQSGEIDIVDNRTDVERLLGFSDVGTDTSDGYVEGCAKH